MGAGLAGLADLASPVPDGLPRLSIFDFQPLADILACHCAAAHTPVTGQMEQGGRRFGAGMRNPAFTARGEHAQEAVTLATRTFVASCDGPDAATMPAAQTTDQAAFPCR